MNDIHQDSHLSHLTAAGLDHLEGLAWLDMYRATPAAFAGSVELACKEMPEAFGLAIRNVGASLFNRALFPRVQQEAIAWLGDHGNAAHAIDACADESDTLHATLEQSGFNRRGGGMAQFWRLAQTPVDIPDSRLTIEAVGREHGADFGNVMTAGYGLPASFSSRFAGLPGRQDWHAYLAFDDGVPVSCAAMYVVDDAAWLGVAATLPQYRELGAQSGLLARRLVDGTASGVRTFAVQTGYPDAGESPGPSFRNIQRAGFALSHVRHRYVASSRR